MAWDVSLFKFSRQYRDASEIAADEQLQTLGSLSDVQATVTSVFPNTDWTDPRWGIFSSEVGSIEFNLGSTDPVESIGLHVRADDPIIDGILLLCERFGCQALDASDGCFLQLSDHPQRNLQKWRAYRDQIIAGSR
jgi:hypothetical protein